MNKPKNKPRYYTLLFCFIIILLFILQAIIPSITELFILNPKAFSGEPWRFITAIFIHGSLPHLLYNLFALALFGLLLEHIIGNKKFLFILFISGIGANIISAHYYESSLGISGAIMGIIGVLAIIRPLMTVWAFGIPMPMFIAAIVWIIGDIIGTIMPSNIGTIAHLTGAGIGLIYGMIIRTHYRVEKKKEENITIPEPIMQHWENTYLKP